MDVNIISGYSDEKILYNHILNVNPKSEQFGLHTHDICELIFLQKGDISGIINGKTYKLKKNDLIIFRPRVVHGIKFNSNREYERINVLFDEKVIANKSFERLPKGVDVVNYSGNNYMIDIFRKLDYYYQNFKDEDLKKLITSLIEEIVFNLTLVENVRNESVMVNSIVDSAIEFIDRNYTEQITVDDICRELYVSKSHLHHLFTEKLHISPKKYINLQRLAKAQEMIRNGLKPYDIYFACGYKDYATFYRNYKQQFGYIPSLENEMKIKRKIES